MERDGEAAVFVVDDDPGLLDAVAMLLGSVGLTARTFSSPLEFLRSVEPDAAGCLVLDLRMPGMSGPQLQSRLLTSGWELPIVFLSAHGDVSTAVEAVKAGAVDFIEKPFDEQRLLDAVHAALALDARRRRARATRRETLRRLDSLTPREREVMALVVDGRHNKAIAQELGISQRTVESHRSRVMTKMGATSTPDLVRTVVRLDG